MGRAWNRLKHMGIPDIHITNLMLICFEHNKSFCKHTTTQGTMIFSLFIRSAHFNPELGPLQVLFSGNMVYIVVVCYIFAILV
jgi:hypothetical protein